jgi:hypothetical protein
MKRLSFYGIFILLLVSCLMWFSGCSTDSTSPNPPQPDTTDTTGPSPSKQHIIIHSAASFNFPDPFPVQPWLQTGGYKYFYSTRSEIMYCQGLVTQNSFVKVRPIRINDGILKKYKRNNGISVGGYWSKSVYQDSLGNWHMAASPRIKKNGRGWNVIVHLNPQKGAQWSPGAPIQNWVVDKVLAGDPETSHPANYAGKYFKDSNGELYLIYVKRITDTDMNGIFAQRMDSPIKVDQNDDPVKLLAPGPYNSEYRNGTSGLKLIETGNVMEIKGKYIIAYTVGAYNRDNYKIGLAWSDHLLGPYKKMLKKDVHNIWRNGAGKPEVYYLLQAQKSNWPNYVKDQVEAPGVPSLDRDSDGKWYLFFAGYYPYAVKGSNGNYNPSERHPFFVQLNVNIPDKRVSSTSSYKLQNWISPVKH